LIIRGADSLRTRSTTFDSFMRQNGNIDPKPGSLAPLGQRVYDSFSDLREPIQIAFSDRSSLAARTKAFRAAENTLKSIDALKIIRLSTLIAPLKSRLQTLKRTEIDELQPLFFASHGVKALVDASLREHHDRCAKRQVDHWVDSEIIAAWGDVELAIAMMDRV
jgi:hypothetical protein